MTTVNLTIRGFASMMKSLPKRSEKAMLRALRKTALRTKVQVVREIDTASPYPAVDRGMLRRSVAVDNLPDGALLSVGAPYAAAIEVGTRPHMPPVQVIKEWVIRKGFVGKKPRGKAAKEDYDKQAESVAWAIALHIKKHGTLPRHYFAKAMTKADAFFVQAVHEEFDRL